MPAPSVRQATDDERATVVDLGQVQITDVQATNVQSHCILLRWLARGSVIGAGVGPLPTPPNEYPTFTLGHSFYHLLATLTLPGFPEKGGWIWEKVGIPLG